MDEPANGVLALVRGQNSVIGSTLIQSDSRNSGAKFHEVPVVHGNRSQCEEIVQFT
jgi:hypothetical protein